MSGQGFRHRSLSRLVVCKGVSAILPQKALGEVHRIDGIDPTPLIAKLLPEINRGEPWRTDEIEHVRESTWSDPEQVQREGPAEFGVRLFRDRLPVGFVG